MSNIARLISEIARRGVQYRNEQMKALELSSRHANYLVEICKAPGISQNCLARRIFTDKSNVARQVALLEEKGLVTCVPSPDDKRVTGLYPTEKALALLPKINAVLDAWEARLTSGLTPEDGEALAALLARLRDRAATWMEVDARGED